MSSPTKKSEAEAEPQSPITFRPCSNGEFCPREETDKDRRAAAEFRALVEEKHRRLGMSRREFAESACGMAAALLTINSVNGCNRDGTGYDVTPDMAEDLGRACAALSGDEFIFDVQIHPAEPLVPFQDPPLPMDAEGVIRMIFVDSDTSVGCLSGVPYAHGLANLDGNRRLQEIIERLGGPRLIFHANADPTQGQAELDYMAEVVSRHKIAAWKVYPHVGPWRLDRGVGLAFLERARALGTRIIAAHRGIGPGVDYAADSSPIDLVLAARMFPDLSFLTYHSAWDSLADENHPFNPADPNPVGVDRLIKAVLDNGVGKDGNVYAELGSTWRNLMGDPMQAGHVLGKLLKHLGEDRIVWGTDSVFTGSPQEQIVAFRRFQIPQQLQEQHGYPALTDTSRRKILGLNGARVYGVDPQAVRCAIAGDFASQLKMARRADPRSVDVPREKSYGPRTRREYLDFLRAQRRGRA
jgi:predicted TIM-barrel fold metal-dependent hydrolase